MTSELKFKFEKDDRDDKIARYYLEVTNWNAVEALKAYKDDLAGDQVDHSIMSLENNPQVAYHHLAYQRPIQYRNGVEMKDFTPMKGLASKDRFTYDVNKKER